MEEGKPRHALKKRDDLGIRIEPMLPRTPCRQYRAGHGKHLGRLPLGDTLGVQLAIPRKQVSAFEAGPALVAIIMATLLALDDGFHGSLLFHPFRLYILMARDDEVAFWFRPSWLSSH
jgi:hypothetical protein